MIGEEPGCESYHRLMRRNHGHGPNYCAGNEPWSCARTKKEGKCHNIKNDNQEQ